MQITLGFWIIMAAGVIYFRAIFNRLRRKKNYLTLVLVVSLVTLWHQLTTNNETNNNNNTTKQSQNSPKPEFKRILFWNRMFRAKYFGMAIGKSAFKAINCKIATCEIFDREDGDGIPVEDFDAILFHPMNLIGETTFLDRPARRNQNQRYIFTLIESPSFFVLNLEQYSNFYNWTATYRQDSDLQFPYGCINEKSLSDQGVYDCKRKWMEPNFENVSVNLSDNRKLAAWFVSRCSTESRRELYVQELKQYVDIDIYGFCAMRHCSYRSADCEEMAENNYKFYLSFENSLCNDYVTEKFFRMMNRGIVPVVYGGADYKKIAPPHSYIDVRDFESPKELANYLLYLSRVPEEYAKYFWWKNYYEYQGSEKVFLCDLCEKLNQPDLPKKVYNDINEWWREDQCRSPYQHFDRVDSNWVIGERGRYFNLLYFNF